MTEYSLFERGHKFRQEQAFGIAFGVVKDVDPPNRLCKVATFMGAGSMNDQFVHQCQWLSTDANPDGDESSCIPRRGTMGLVYFVDGEAFFWGAYKPLGKDGVASQGTEAPSLTEGDKVISTVAGNRLTIKRSGLIELYSKDTLQRVMHPGLGAIFDTCKEYHLNVMEGGTVHWAKDSFGDATLYKAEYRKDLLRTNVIIEEKGHVSPTTIYRASIGSPLPGVNSISLPVYTKEITVGGEITTTASLPQVEGSPFGYKSVINGPAGSISLSLGASQSTTVDVKTTGEIDVSVNKLAKLNISAKGDILAEGPAATFEMGAKGDVKIENLVAKLTISAAGEVVIDNDASTVTISPSGEVKIKANNKITMEAMSGFDVKSLGPVNIEGNGPMSIKTKGIIALDGGTGASDFVLTNPTTLSPFTGAPLAPFSTTIQVSK